MMTKFEKRFGKGFVCTDPDTYQYRKEISHTEYEFVEVKRFPGMTMPETLDEAMDTCFWYNGVINLKDYTEVEINNYISAYYPSVDTILEFYGNSANAIIAECIFELETQY